MKLKIYIIEDKVSEADKIKELLTKAYKDENWEKYFQGVYVKDNDIIIIPGSKRGTDDNGIEHLFYEQDKILNEMTQIVRQKKMEESIGICLDIKLTKEEENRESENSPFICKTARDLYRLRNERVFICPITTLAKFDERSYEIIGESVGNQHINRNFLADEGGEYALFSLAYFFVHGKMPENKLLDEIFGYD